jgi:2-succinyl-6-hydroxy-2,4-cyclohexadiene-1-carboxylate synthase
MWSEVAAGVGGAWLVPDLPGHGPEPVVPWDVEVARLTGFLVMAPPPRLLLGYSMGGRLALAVALAEPALLDGLVLVAASPGIADDEQRRERAAADETLAAHIEEAGVAAFVEEWLAREMFAGLKRRGEAWLEQDRARRTTNTAAGLAGALRSLGPGAQPWLGERLGEFEKPVRLVVGAEDRRYLDVAGEMEAWLPNGQMILVPESGHAVVGEQPDAVAGAVMGLLGESGGIG